MIIEEFFIQTPTPIHIRENSMFWSIIAVLFLLGLALWAVGCNYFSQPFTPRSSKWLPASFHPENWTLVEKLFFLSFNSPLYSAGYLWIVFIVTGVLFPEQLDGQNVEKVMEYVGVVFVITNLAMPWLVGFSLENLKRPLHSAIPSPFPFATLLSLCVFTWSVYFVGKHTDITLQRSLLIGAILCFLWAFVLAMIVKNFLVEIARDLPKLPNSIAGMLFIILLFGAFFLVTVSFKIVSFIPFWSLTVVNFGFTFPVLLNSLYQSYLQASAKREKM